jgi:hypothetical protein
MASVCSTSVTGPQSSLQIELHLLHVQTAATSLVLVLRLLPVHRLICISWDRPA